MTPEKPIGLNEFTKAADAVQELRNMADRELASAARKAHAEVTEAVAELMAIAEKQKAEIKRLRAELAEANERADGGWTLHERILEADGDSKFYNE